MCITTPFVLLIVYMEPPTVYDLEVSTKVLRGGPSVGILPSCHLVIFFDEI
jgi:hypothetical protein